MTPPIRRILCAITVLFVTSCGGQREPAEPAPAAEPATPAKPADSTKPADEPNAAPDPCIAECLRENQARATDWAQVERECAAECSKKTGD